MEGGLGNQIWHYAVAYLLGERLKTSIILDARFYKPMSVRSLELINFNLKNVKITQSGAELKKWLDVGFLAFCALFIRRLINRIFNKFFGFLPFGKQVFFKRVTLFRPHEQFSSLEECARYLEQNPQIKYIQEEYLWDFRNMLAHRDFLRGVLSPTPLLNAKIKTSSKFGVLERIKKCPNACAIHVRRGDFLELQHIDAYKVLGMDFYSAAMEIVRERFSDAGGVKFFIFGNGIDFMRENFTATDCEVVESKEWEVSLDFVLMRACTHHIVANSSLSTWVGFLSKGLVICKDEHFHGLHFDCIDNLVCL